MNLDITNLALALATNELLHNFMEVKNMQQKLVRLTAFIDKKPYNEFLINIDTRVKSYAISLVALIVFVIPLWTVYELIDFEQTRALKLIVGILIASYVVTVITVDKWHVDIEQITKRFKKK